MRTLLTFLVICGALAPAGSAYAQPGQNSSLELLELKLKFQHSTIEKLIANPPGATQSASIILPGQPSSGFDPVAYRLRIRAWQDELAQSFKAAGEIVAEILKLNPPNREFWSERLETFQLYSAPVSPPDQRSIFGAREVQKRARLTETPLADYPNAARAAKTRGDVRLRMVLAADGTVKNVFALKSLPHGLTGSAMAAARKIKFEPAIRNGKPASQFLTLVYEFEKGGARKPYVPQTEF